MELTGRPWQYAAELIACLATGAILSIAAGQDASWDLRNYHLYNAASVLDGRRGLDFFPADKQSGLNPLLDFLYVWLGRGRLAESPRILAGIAGCCYGLLAFTALQFNRLVFAGLPPAQRRIFTPLSFALSVSGGLTMSQIGASSHDVTIAWLVLLGLYVVVRDSAADRVDGKNFLLSGLIFGFAAGAKLTAAPFAAALLAAVVLVLPWRQARRGAIAFSAGWLAGFMAAFGWWGWRLWQDYGNPFFPMLNGVFHSRQGPQQNLTDLRFLPRSLWQGLAYPFYWAWDKNNHLVYEFDFRDPRLALAYVACLVLAAGQALRAKDLAASSRALSRSHQTIIIFAVGSYFLWLPTTSILRYALILEILAFPVALIILFHFVSSFRARLVLAASSALFCIALAGHADWGHSKFSAKTFAVDLSWVQPQTLFIGVYEPAAYLVALTPPALRAQYLALGFLAYLRGWPAADAGERIIREHHGPIIVLFREQRRAYLNLLRAYGLSPAVKNCRVIQSNLSPPQDPVVFACAVDRLSWSGS